MVGANEDVSVKHYKILQHTATHCDTLQYTATHCNTLQQMLDLWQKMVGADEDMRSRIVADAAALVESGSVLQCVLQCVAV